MNCYGTLTQLKANLGITATTDNAILLRCLEGASRLIDSFCNRSFYVWEGAKYFDGASPLFITDLLAESEFKTDEDGDLDYDNTLATTDYILYPLNDFPKTYIRLTPDSNYSGFGGSVKKGAKITGKWGYGDGISATPCEVTSVTVTVADATATTLTLSAEGTIEAGHTILVESEQMYISAVTADGTMGATAERAVNGTTGAAHSAKAASIYKYPRDVCQACLQAAETLFETRGKVFSSERLGDYSYTAKEAALELGTLVYYRRIGL